MSLPPTSAQPPPLSAHGMTHPGKKRDQNEDAIGVFAEKRLFVVADGVGGHNAGEVASNTAVEELADFFGRFHARPQQPWPHPVDPALSLGANLLRVGLKVANDKVRADAAADKSRARMACTIAALAIGDQQVAVAHLGDARVYRLRGPALKRLTTDHSVLEEIRAARPNMMPHELTAFAHRNVVTKSVGSKPEVEPTVLIDTLAPKDLYLLCTDGLWSPLKDDRIATILQATPELDAVCQLLIDAANEAGGPDNISAVLVRVD